MNYEDILPIKELNMNINNFNIENYIPWKWIYFISTWKKR